MLSTLKINLFVQLIQRANRVWLCQNGVISMLSTNSGNICLQKTWYTNKVSSETHCSQPYFCIIFASDVRALSNNEIVLSHV